MAVEPAPPRVFSRGRERYYSVGRMTTRHRPWEALAPLPELFSFGRRTFPRLWRRCSLSAQTSRS